MLTGPRFRTLLAKKAFDGFPFRACGRLPFRNWLAKSRSACSDEPELSAQCTVALAVSFFSRRKDFFSYR
jgi:hypothetical protein